MCKVHVQMLFLLFLVPRKRTKMLKSGISSEAIYVYFEWESHDKKEILERSFLI